MDMTRNSLTLTLNMKCTEVICHKSFAYKPWLGMCPWNGSHVRWSTFVYCFCQIFHSINPTFMRKESSKLSCKSYHRPHPMPPLQKKPLALLYLCPTWSTWQQILCTIYVKAVWSSKCQTSYKYICPLCKGHLNSNFPQVMMGI